MRIARVVISRAVLSLVAGAILVPAYASAQAPRAPEPFLQLVVHRDCASLEQEKLLSDEVQLRIPQAFIVRGVVDGVRPDWRVRWSPGATGACDLSFESDDNASRMPLPRDAEAAEIQLAASRIAWLASVSRPDLSSPPGPDPEEVSVDAAEPSEDPDASATPPEASEEEASPEAAEPTEEKPAGDKPPVPPPLEAPSHEGPPERSLDYVGLKLSLLPGISYPAPDSFLVDDVPTVSINTIGGHHAGLEGFELGLAFNHESDFVRGVQLAGGVNLVGGDVVGVQLSGLANLNGSSFEGLVASFGINSVMGSMHGLQLAGLGNWAGGDLSGVQFALGANLAGREVAGVQLSSGLNVAGRLRGVQGTYGLNVARALDGVQTGALNVADDARGLQFGLYNQGDRVRGVQLGVVNVAESADLPLGLLNIQTKEPLLVNAYGTMGGSLLVGLKHGGRYLRYSYLAGATPLREVSNWMIGIGIGGHIPFEPLFLEADYVLFNIVPSDTAFWKVSLLHHIALSVGYKLSRRVALFAGINGNLLVSGLAHAEVLPPGFAAEIETAGATRSWRWPGLHAGLRF